MTKSLFATTPAELINLPSDIAGDRMSRAFELGLFAAAQSLLFSAPFAIVAAAIGEWRHVRSWIYYAVIGVAIALIGFLAQYSSELPGQASIANNYALSAFLTSGFVGGLVYWLVAGRGAGNPPTRPTSQLGTAPNSVPTTTKA